MTRPRSPPSPRRWRGGGGQLVAAAPPLRRAVPRAGHPVQDHRRRQAPRADAGIPDPTRRRASSTWRSRRSSASPTTCGSATDDDDDDEAARARRVGLPGEGGILGDLLETLGIPAEAVETIPDDKLLDLERRLLKLAVARPTGEDGGDGVHPERDRDRPAARVGSPAEEATMSILSPFADARVALGLGAAEERPCRRQASLPPRGRRAPARRRSRWLPAHPRRLRAAAQSVGARPGAAPDPDAAGPAPRAARRPAGAPSRRHRRSAATPRGHARRSRRVGRGTPTDPRAPRAGRGRERVSDPSLQELAARLDDLLKEVRRQGRAAIAAQAAAESCLEALQARGRRTTARLDAPAGPNEGGPPPTRPPAGCVRSSRSPTPSSACRARRARSKRPTLPRSAGSSAACCTRAGSRRGPRRPGRARRGPAGARRPARRHTS